MLLLLGGLRKERRRVFITSVIRNVDRLMKRVKEKLKKFMATLVLIVVVER